MKPEDFILTTDYATLKNDAVTSLSIVLPSSVIISAAGTAMYSATATAGSAGSSIRTQIMSTKDNKWFTMNTVNYVYFSGASPGGNYVVYVSLSRTSATTIRLLVSIPNKTGSTMTITGLSQTITADIATFLPPFS